VKDFTVNNIQNILNTTFPLIEKLLKDYGEFHPLASFSRLDGTVEQLLDFDGTDMEFPNPDTIISNLKKAFIFRKEELAAIAIFKDVWIKEQELDAVVVFVEDKDDTSAYSLVYPYKLEDGELEFFKPWKQLEEKEIFLNNQSNN
jgi:hypothetical protein